MVLENPLYVGAGVQTWLVDIPERRVEKYDVGGGEAIYGAEDIVEIVGVRIAVVDLLL